MILTKHTDATLGHFNAEASYGLQTPLRRLTVAVQRYINHHRNNPAPVDNANPLVGFCQHLAGPYTDSVLELLERASDAYNQFSTLYGFTSIHDAGSVRETYVYDNAEEMLLVTRGEYSDISKLMSMPWQEISPLKVIAHSSTDMATEYTTDELVFMKLDITALTYQMNKWEEQEQKRSEDPDYVRETINVYVRKYLITNLMWSHINTCLFNAICRREVEFTNSHKPYHMEDTTKVVEDIIEETHRRLSKTLPTDQTLDLILGLNDTRMSEHVALPKVPFNRNTAWWFIGSQLVMSIPFYEAFKVTDSSVIANRLKYVRRTLRNMTAKPDGSEGVLAGSIMIDHLDVLLGT